MSQIAHEIGDALMQGARPTYLHLLISGGKACVLAPRVKSKPVYGVESVKSQEQFQGATHAHPPTNDHNQDWTVLAF